MRIAGDYFGQLSSIVTPSGQLIGYAYSINRISEITVNGTPLITNILYAPFGPTRGWQWGNGTFTAREYDTDGQLTTIESAGFTTYTYNADRTIQSRSDDAPTPDSLSNPSLAINVSPTSNRIVSVVDTATRTYTYDAAGNTTSNGSHTFVYTDAGRMVSSTIGGSTTTYAYNGLGQRVRKSSPGQQR